MVTYTAVATVNGGRNGSAHTFEPDMNLTTSLPVVMGGTGEGTNPEQLFAMGWGACFQGAMGVVAKEMRISALKLADSIVRTSVTLNAGDEGADLSTRIEVFVPGLELEVVQELADGAHAFCPYSKATRGNIPVEVVAVDSL